MLKSRLLWMVAGMALTVAGCEAGATDGSTTPTADGMTALDAGDSSLAPEASTPSVALSADLQFLREEEKLARDVYVTLSKTWSNMPLKNISGSEQVHMDAVLGLLGTYGLADPASPDVPGHFQDEALSELYSQLTEKGAVSELEAMVVGATIEDLDIRDIQEMAARTVEVDVLAVLTNLECGSRNHMRAFVGQLKALGGNYTAQFITAESVDAIVNSPRETCGAGL
jgi:hypothetical protein